MARATRICGMGAPRSGVKQACSARCWCSQASVPAGVCAGWRSSGAGAGRTLCSRAKRLSLGTPCCRTNRWSSWWSAAKGEVRQGWCTGRAAMSASVKDRPGAATHELDSLCSLCTGWHAHPSLAAGRWRAGRSRAARRCAAARRRRPHPPRLPLGALRAVRKTGSAGRLGGWVGGRRARRSAGLDPPRRRPRRPPAPRAAS